MILPILIFSNLIFILLSAFFSASETAFFSIRRERLVYFKNHTQKPYRLVYTLLTDGQRTLLLILLGNIFVNITLTGLIFSLMERFFPRDAALMSLVVATVMIVMLGEILPKNIALKNNEKLAVFFAPIFNKLKNLLLPVLNYIQNINQKVLNRVRERMRKPSPFVTMEELEYGIRQSVQEGVITVAEEPLITSILEQGAEPAKKFMIHRSMVSIFKLRTTVSEAIKEMVRLNHTYALVSNPREKQQIRGIVHLNEIIRKKGETLLSDCYTKVHWVHDTIEVSNLLTFMFRKKVTEVCVLDEFGAFSGVYSTSSGLDKLFNLALFERKIMPGKDADAMVFKGLQDMEAFQEWLPETLRSFLDDSRTLNGVLCRFLERIPATGEEFNIDGWIFYIIKASPTKIDSVLVKRSGRFSR
ncbi:Hemolysins-related protein containing CBS domain [Chitinispirillum alkaliphilum]|nr:Hemolysins-related protein containing CBS domain [Chitinispirillum alkaliphilum]